jgi:maleate isomerase
MLAEYRIGMITPSVNTALEPLTMEMLKAVDEDVSVHFTRIEVHDVGLDDESSRQFTFEAFLEAARLLVDAQVQVVAWNGTSGGWMGIDLERGLAKRIEDILGVPFTTTTLAMVSAMQARRVRRWGLAIPYTIELADQVGRNYGAEGLECVRKTVRNWQTEGEVAATPADLRLMMEEAYEPGADAVAVVCTNLAAAPLVVDFENEFDTTVFDSIAVTFHQCLGACGIAQPVINGWGRALDGRTVAG